MVKCDNYEVCEKEAEYKCPKCGILYCVECASNGDYECDCVKLPKLEKIKC